MGTSVLFTCSHKPQERQDEERGPTGKDAQDEAEEGREEDGGPAQEVQEGPRPSGRLDLLPWEHTGLLVHLLQGILRVKGGDKIEIHKCDSDSGENSATNTWPGPRAKPTVPKDRWGGALSWRTVSCLYEGCVIWTQERR